MANLALPRVQSFVSACDQNTGRNLAFPPLEIPLAIRAAFHFLVRES
jgi:hypothetical protein